MRTWKFADAKVSLVPAWTSAEVHAAVNALIAGFESRLPADRGARVVIKPNLNNDLVALTGNCADLRVLDALFANLRDRGYHDITVADGSNVGVERRDIDTFKRLRLDRLAARFGVRCVDLNHAPGRELPLRAGGKPSVAELVLDAECLISVPKVKTHAEATLSCAMKNWVGICRGQQKREVHRDLGWNILALNERVRPHLILVDGLVGMEGNGPGDGQPFRLGQLIASDNAFVNDLVVSRLMGVPWREVPYLARAVEARVIHPALPVEVEAEVPVLRPILRAPRRSKLAELSELGSLRFLKLAVRPLVERPRVAEAAYKLKIVQDVYSRTDDTITGFVRNPAVCGDCRKCEEVCPTQIPLARIGLEPMDKDCVGCMYCWWVCPQQAITLRGELNHLERQVKRYKAEVEAL